MAFTIPVLGESSGCVLMCHICVVKDVVSVSSGSYA